MNRPFLSPQQKFPRIWLKIGPLILVTSWPDKIPHIQLKFSTLSSRETHYCASLWLKKVIGPFYLVKEYDFEVVKKTTDVTHPYFKNTEKGKRMAAERERALQSKENK